VPYAIYKVIHLLGIMMLFLSFGAMLNHAINGGTKETNRWGKAAAMTHGIGLLLALIGGFGLLAKLHLFWPMPGWAMLKILIWFILGGIISMIYKKPSSGKALWIVTLVLGLLAAYLANAKPF
jgi:NADH:ubiquinone oxidoreductase subunit 6 (subunit J)